MLGKVAFLILLLAAACSPKPATPPPAPVQVAAPPKPVTPPKLMKMVCRDSETGKKVACGAPHAVMVGMTDK